MPYSNCDLGYKENEMSSVGHYLLTERTRDDGKMIFLKRRWKCLWSFSVAWKMPLKIFLCIILTMGISMASNWRPINHDEVGNVHGCFVSHKSLKAVPNFLNSLKSLVNCLKK